MSLEEFMNPPIEEEQVSKTESLVNVGSKLKTLRNKAGYSANKSCEILRERYGVDVSINSLNSYESDRRLPNIQVFFALCDLYGCNDISGFFEIAKKSGTKTKITLEDYGVKEIVDLLFTHYGRTRCVEIINCMVKELAK